MFRKELYLSRQQAFLEQSLLFFSPFRPKTNVLILPWLYFGGNTRLLRRGCLPASLRPPDTLTRVMRAGEALQAGKLPKELALRQLAEGYPAPWGGVVHIVETTKRLMKL